MKVYSKVLIVLLILMAFSAGVFLYMYFFEKKERAPEDTEISVVAARSIDEERYKKMLEHINTEEVLNTDLYFSAGRLKPERTGLVSTVYNFADETFSEIYAGDSEYGYYYIDEQPENEQGIFIDKPKVVLGRQAFSPGVYLRESGGVRQLDTFHSNLDTEEYLYRIRMPRLSPSGEQYTYFAQTWLAESPEPELYNPDEWKVFLGSIDGSSREVVSGHGAQWVDENHLIYIKPDGLHMLQIDSGETFHLVTDYAQYLSNNHIDISDDGKYVAISQPNIQGSSVSVVDIFEIELLDTKPNAAFVYRLEVDAVGGQFWPLFSPEGRYLSMQTRNISEDYSEDNEIAVYDFVERAFVATVDFNDYNFDAAFNTDWE